jgi:hypothetical protein
MRLNIGGDLRAGSGEGPKDECSTFVHKRNLNILMQGAGMRYNNKLGKPDLTVFS